MTRKEREDTINFLKGYLDEEVYTEKCRNAHKMAIKVLEQEPCEDAISRQSVIDCFKKWQPYMATRLWEFEIELKALPSVQPKSKTDILDKIRAEIEEAQTYDGIYIDRYYVLQIIDKYKSENENKEIHSVIDGNFFKGI